MEKSSELRDVAIRFYQALTNGDVSSVEGFISQQDGVIFIGTDPDEWWSGYPSLSRAWRAQMEELGGKFPIAAGDLQAYVEGSVGWVADRPKFSVAGTEIPLRATFIFHREDGGWKLVQGHFSLGAPNEEVVGKELTI